MNRFPWTRALCAAACALTLAATASHAQTFPSRTIRLVVPAAAGGPTDTLGRILAQVMAEQSRVPVVVENKAGASGSIGVGAVVQSPPDGYTLLISVPDAVTVYPQVKKNPPYRGEKDLTPIAMVAGTNYIFVVNAQSPAQTMKDFAALAKTKSLSFSSPGAGSSGHIVLEMLRNRFGVEMLHVPYKGAGPALQAVAAGETDFSASSPITIKGFVEAGKLRPLAVTSERRNAVLPQAPTMAEAGFPDFVVSAWFAVFAPAGVPEPLADRLHEMVAKAMGTPEFLNRVKALGLDIDPIGRREFAQMIAAETGRWKRLIESANISVNE